MDDFRELYRQIEYLRNNGIKMKEIADCAGIQSSKIRTGTRLRFCCSIYCTVFSVVSSIIHIFHPCNYIFTFDKTNYLEFREMGVEHIWYLPLAVDNWRQIV